jgi:translocation and assembly module TamA
MAKRDSLCPATLSWKPVGTVPRLLALLMLLVGGSTALHAQPAPQPEPAPAGVPLVAAAGVDGTTAAALDEALARYTLAPEADEADEELALRRAERTASEVMATEGFFSPSFRFELNPAGPPRYRLLVTPGPLTRVSAVTLDFKGALAEPQFAARAAELRREWALPVGAPFRSAQWEAAKSRLLLATGSHDFAAAAITESAAEVDPENASATLRLELDSGPAYRVGALQVEGLNRFDRALVERFNPFKPGQPYDRALLLQFQQSLQESGFFSTVVATLDTDGTAADAPIRVQLSEALLRRFAAGVGFATNTGAHLEMIYRQSITFGQPYQLQTGFRIDKTGQFAYTDLIFPPQRTGARDSVGALIENSDIENLRVNRWSVGAARSKLTGPRDGRNVETQWTINFEHERRETPLDPPITLDALSTSYTWTRRAVDDITNPRSGNLLQLQGSVGFSGFSLSDVFLRGFGSIVQFVPVGERDVLILRGQVGGVEAESTNNVPNKFLFRTGGSLTVRGYDYESLGVEQGGAIVGGRALAVASVEYVHWLRQWGGNWGVAAFVDAGDAAARFASLEPALGYGLGARWRTPAGPLAIDLAWGARFDQLRVQFSVAIAF